MTHQRRNLKNSPTPPTMLEPLTLVPVPVLKLLEPVTTTIITADEAVQKGAARKPAAGDRVDQTALEEFVTAHFDHVTTTQDGIACHMKEEILATNVVIICIMMATAGVVAAAAVAAAEEDETSSEAKEDITREDDDTRRLRYT